MINGLFSQLMLIILSGAILLTYVEPTFRSIGQLQDDIAVYRGERGKVEEVNQRLNELAAERARVTPSEEAQLATYLPTTVDPVVVQRDLFIIAESADVLFRDVSFTAEESRSSRSSADDDVPARLQPYSFSLQVTGTYEQIRNFLPLLERNKYPLELQSLDVTPLEGGFMDVSLSLVTYKLQTAVEAES